MEVIFFQLFIIATIVATHVLKRNWVVWVCFAWTVETIVLLFYAPLILIQLGVIWVTWLVLTKIFLQKEQIEELERFILISLALLVLSTTPAFATVINYVESVNGDIDGNPTFNLDMAGTNTWMGTISARDAPSGGGDLDPFGITVDPSVFVSGYSVAFSNPAYSPEVFRGTFFIDLREPPGFGNLQNENYDVVSETHTITLGPPTFPLLAAALSIHMANGANSTVHSYSFQTGYTIFIDTSAVSAVPVPAAVWLFGTALIGLIGFGKRRKAA